MPKKILVADYSPTLRNIVESLLKKHGYEVLFADNGTEALEVAKANKPDLIFLDDSLSVLNGEQVLIELKQSKTLEDVPVVMLLSRDQTDKVQKLKQIGADAFIAKPFNHREILDHVRRLLEKETQKTASPTHRGNSEDVLDIVETSDLVEEFEPSDPASNREPIHGFDWFMAELKKEAEEHKKANSLPEKKPILSEQKISEEKPDYKKESKIYEIDEHEKGYEDLLSELKQEVKESDKEKSTSVKPSTTEETSRSEFDQLFSDLKEKISERVANEVAKKISPEFLEKIIREELAKLRKDSS